MADMTDPAIRAALEAAHQANRDYASEYDNNPTWDGTAAAIAAFLRALPGLTVCGRNACYLQQGMTFSPEMLAAAVEEAARDGS